MVKIVQWLWPLTYVLVVRVVEHPQSRRHGPINVQTPNFSWNNRVPSMTSSRSVALSASSEVEGATFTPSYRIQIL